MMRKLFRWIAGKCGMETDYHIYAINGTSYISFTCTVSPWLHEENYSDLIEYAGNLVENKKGRVAIASITKLGI